MANLGINVGVDEKLAADVIALNGESAFRQAVAVVYDDVVSGRKVCAAAGTAERLTAFAGTLVGAAATITAELDNTGVVCIGGAGVVAALSTRTGTPLEAGDSVTVNLVDLYALFIDAEVSGDGVTYNLWT